MKGEKRSLRQRFGLGPHHRIERFGVLSTMLSLVLILLAVGVGVRTAREDAITFTDQAVYTTEFTFSQSGVRGEVIDVYRNEEHTKAFLLVKLGDGFVQSLSQDAKNYELFLTGTNAKQKQRPLKSNPKASFYLFGYTGYVGILFTDVQGFEPQIWDLVIRSNKSFVDPGAASTSNVDASFATFDQALLYFSPAGLSAKTVPFLDMEESSVFEMFAQTVSRPREEAIEYRLNTQLASMRTALDRIASYQADVDRLNIKTPKVPEEIAGDVVTMDEENRLEVSIENRDGVVENFSDPMYKLDTNFVVDNGYDLNWQESSVEFGYLDAIRGSYSPRQFLEMRAESQDVTNIKVQGLDFRRADGSVIQYGDYYNQGGLSQDAESIAVTNLTNAWEEYFDLKREYQTTLQTPLLLLELETRDVETNYTNQLDSDALLYLY